MPQILGVEGEAVVLYREPSTTQEMRYPRLSRRVNKMAVFSCFQDTTSSGFQHSIKNKEIACICSFLAYVAILFMQLRGLSLCDISGIEHTIASAWRLHADRTMMPFRTVYHVVPISFYCQSILTFRSRANPAGIQIPARQFRPVLRVSLQYVSPRRNMSPQRVWGF